MLRSIISLECESPYLATAHSYIEKSSLFAPPHPNLNERCVAHRFNWDSGIVFWINYTALEVKFILRDINHQRTFAEHVSAKNEADALSQQSAGDSRCFSCLIIYFIDWSHDQ
jgi:hypothetical protein